MKVSIVIPVYNEHKTVATVLDRVRALPFEKEIIVVDDGSQDGTREVLDAYPKNAALRIIHHETNLGKGAAVRRGFEFVTGDIVTIQDADLELDPTDLATLIEPIIAKTTDVVFGSRYLGRERIGNLLFYLGNRGLSLFTNLLYGSRLTDVSTCYKIFRRDVLATLKLQASGFNIDPEITAQILRRKYRVVELPISYFPRSKADGKKISWRDGPVAFATLLKGRLR